MLTVRNAALKLSGILLRQQQRIHWRLESGKAGLPAQEPYVLKNTPSTSDHLVVHVNGNFVVGGSTQLIVDLIELMSDAYRHEVVVPLCPKPAPYEPVTVRGYPLDRLQDLHAYLADARPDLVHIHYWSRDENRYDATGIWYSSVLRICANLSLPVVQNVNVPTKPMIGDAVRHNVFVSQYVLDEYGSGMVPASVTYPGSDFSHFQRRNVESRDPNTIGMVYRLDNDKLGIGSIEPFIAVAQRRRATRCLVVGDGMFLNSYRQRVAQAGVSSQFEFTGMVSYKELPGLYERMSVFVTPVHNESFGQVTPFAMSMELPVAGYEVGALAEILGSTEMLVAPDNVDALASLLVKLLDAPEQRQQLGKLNAARAHALFSREVMVESYRKLYAIVLQSEAVDA